MFTTIKAAANSVRKHPGMAVAGILIGGCSVMGSPLAILALAGAVLVVLDKPKKRPESEAPVEPKPAPTPEPEFSPEYDAYIRVVGKAVQMPAYLFEAECVASNGFWAAVPQATTGAGTDKQGCIVIQHGTICITELDKFSVMVNTVDGSYTRPWTFVEAMLNQPLQTSR